MSVVKVLYKLGVLGAAAGIIAVLAIINSDAWKEQRRVAQACDIATRKVEEINLCRYSESCKMTTTLWEDALRYERLQEQYCGEE